MIYVLALLTGLFTVSGGWFQIKHDQNHWIRAFAAGSLLGVAIFDLFPESIELSSKSYAPVTCAFYMALGFIVYLIISNLISLTAHKEQCENPLHETVGASSLCAHSFMDGLGMGLAWMVNPAIGFTVAFGVLAHDFNDGLNTAFLAQNKKVWQWVIADALAPLVGICTAQFIHVPQTILGLILAFFSGLFLYIASADLIPEAHHRHPKFITTFMIVLGIFFIWGILKLVSQ